MMPFLAFLRGSLRSLTPLACDIGVDTEPVNIN